MRYLTIADVCSVQPHVKAGIHTLKIQVCFRSTFFTLIRKLMDIRSAWIIYRHIRRIQWNRILYIGILMTVISEILPVSRYRNFIIRFQILFFLIKWLIQIINALIITKFPVSV